MISYKITIVDDEEALAKGIAASLSRDYETQSFINAEEALAAIKNDPPDLVLLDIGLPGMSGIEALAEIKKDFPDILVIMITAFEDINTVVSAMRLGAYDYVIKPIQMDSLGISVRNALSTISLRKEVKELQEKYLQENLPLFIGASEIIQDLIQFIENIGKSTDTPVLVVGETGTGKELIAGAIHYRSPRFKDPLITVNCAAVPKDLIESELFGYEKGAFSGASPTGKKGLIELADAGTLFLDEIGDLSLEAQAKLLRFLESGEFYKVGGTRKRRSRARIISATNKDIGKMIEDGLFREDLFFRISVIKIEIPALNERPDDILPMAKHFLMGFTKKFGKNFTSISPEAVSALKAHHWRGNVRELKNILERAVLIGKGPELTVQDLGLKASNASDPTIASSASADAQIPATGINLDDRLADLEKHYIQEALRMADGNETGAAELLQMKYTTLRYRRRKLNIP